MAKKDQSFPTWSFDEACASIQWTETSSITIEATTDKETSADLVLIGIFAKKDKDGPHVLADSAKAVDESIDGALSEILEENQMSFQGAAGTISPTYRHRAGGKVRVWHQCHFAEWPTVPY